MTLKRIAVEFEFIICLNFSYKHNGIRNDIPKYSHAPHNILVNSGPYIQWRSRKTVMELKYSYLLVTLQLLSCHSTMHYSRVCGDVCEQFIRPAIVDSNVPGFHIHLLLTH